jgi:3-oxoacyl-ACP reductase-like protein
MALSCVFQRFNSTVDGIVGRLLQQVEFHREDRACNAGMSSSTFKDNVAVADRGYMQASVLEQFLSRGARVIGTCKRGA